MAKKQRRRPPRSSLVLRWLAVGALVLVGLLYYRPSARTSSGATRSRREAGAGERARAGTRARAPAPLRRASEAAVAREARRLGYVKPGERLFIVKGIPAGGRRAARRGYDRPAVDDKQIVERQLGRAPRAFRPRRRPLSVGPAGRDRAGAVRRERRAVPDDVLRHVPTPRRQRSRASRRPAGVERWTAAARRTTPRSPRACARRTRAAPAPTRAPRSESGARRAAEPQVPARPRRVRARTSRATSSASGSSREVEPLWPTDDCCMATSPLTSTPHVGRFTVELARRQWEEGHRRFDCHAAVERAPRRLLDALDAVTDELRRRSARRSRSTSSHAAYDAADDWVRDARRRPRRLPGWPRSLSTSATRRSTCYARGATDYAP